MFQHRTPERRKSGGAPAYEHEQIGGVAGLQNSHLGSVELTGWAAARDREKRNWCASTEQEKRTLSIRCRVRASSSPSSTAYILGQEALQVG